MVGCKDSATPVSLPDEEETAVAATKPEPHTIGLEWNSKAPLNPYDTNDEKNLYLSRLIYDSLFIINKDYQPVNLLAKECLTGDNIKYAITLKDNVYFHSGKKLTSEDLLYTINYILSNQNSIYYERLKNIDSVEITDELSLIINLKSPDAFFTSMLDFPVIKKNMSKKDYDGTGRYRFKDNKLEYNYEYHNKVDPLVTEISLIDTSGDVSVLNEFESGNIKVSELKGELAYNLNLEKKVAGSIVTNDLIYLGINNSRRYLSNHNVRKAISYAINRVEDCDGFVGSKPYVTYSPINPKWYLFDKEAVLGEYSIELAKKHLRDAGLKQNGDKPIITLNILVNSDNYDKVGLAERIAVDLKKIGIELSINKQPWNDYLNILSSGNFDLYIGEIRIKNDMDLSSLLYSSGKLNYGRYSNLETDNYINSLKNIPDADKQKVISEFIKNLQEEMPIIPLYFNVKDFVVKKDSEFKLDSTISDIFNGIETARK